MRPFRSSGSDPSKVKGLVFFFVCGEEKTLFRPDVDSRDDEAFAEEIKAGVMAVAESVHFLEADPPACR